MKMKYQYPLRKHNRFTLLIDGDNYFSAMLKSIKQAKKTILLEQYLVNSGNITSQFIEQLCSAAERGVSVYVLLDDFGASGLHDNDRKQLISAGVSVNLYNPVRFKRFFRSLFRNHRKILIIDNEVAYVGGAGLSDEFSRNQYGEQAWHDVMLEIRGEIVNDWQELVITGWPSQFKQFADKTSTQKPPTIGHQTGRLLSSSPLHRQEINRALINHLRLSRRLAWITSPYFVTTRKIRRELRRAAQRGVDVRLLMPGKHSDHPWISFAARHFYTRLLRSGVRIFEYQPRFTHAKIELCDDWVSIGSSNLDRWNQHWNLDANQSIHDHDFTRKVRSLFVENFNLSNEINYPDWQQRSCLLRLKEKISGLLVSLLEKLMHARRK